MKRRITFLLSFVLLGVLCFASCDKTKGTTASSITPGLSSSVSSSEVIESSSQSEQSSVESSETPYTSYSQQSSYIEESSQSSQIESSISESSTVESSSSVRTTYTISFDTNGGSEIAPIVTPLGSSFEAPSDPTKYGYNFIGWYSSSSYDEAFDFTIIDLDRTAYAKFERDESISLTTYSLNTKFNVANSLLASSSDSVNITEDTKISEFFTVSSGSKYKTGSQSMSFDGVSMSNYFQTDAKFMFTVGTSGTITVYASQTGSDKNRNICVCDEAGTVLTNLVATVKKKDAECVILTYEITTPGNYYVCGMENDLSAINMLNYYQISFDSNEYVTEMIVDDTQVKKEFTNADTFDASNLSVSLKLSGGQVIALMDTEYSIAGYDLTTLGKQTITISYKDALTKTYEINVKEFVLEATGIELDTSAIQTKYTVGDAFDKDSFLSDLVVYLVYNNGTKEVCEFTIAFENDIQVENGLLVGKNTYNVIIISKDYSELTSSLKIRVVDATGLADDDIVVSASATGLGSGTALSPTTLANALSIVEPGQTIAMLAGTYSFSDRVLIDVDNSGTEGNVKTLKAAEAGTVVLDFSSQATDTTARGLQVNASYWYFYGFKIYKAGDNGMMISGNYNTVELCEFEGNRDTGLQISRRVSTLTEMKDWPHDILIKNCTSYNNCDESGENADGFAAKLTCGENIVFDGCISHHNSDDGWDCYTKTESGPIGAIKFYNCIAYSNGFLTDGTTLTDGDRNGFKLGGEDIAVSHYLENCIAFNNGCHGFTDNSNPGTITLVNCTAYNNSALEAGSKSNFDMNRDGIGNNVLKNCLSYSTIKCASDKYRGTGEYSLFFKKDKTTWEAIKASSSIDQSTASAETIALPAITNVFVDATIPTDSFDPATGYRDAEGNIKLGDFLKINQAYVQGILGTTVEIGAVLE